ncbi:glycosyltransferase family 61 protein [Synechococcus sp. MU1651]|uniref:glycosyltransferase 61 family protein n=1 Tax=Synechococcus sp. MU1651 TaxID=2508353 RepID=UPI002026086E
MGWIGEVKDWSQLIWEDWRFRTRQPGRWQRMTLRDVPVAPIEELLMRWAGGSVWRGGPQLMPWHPICPGLRHYRGDEPADDPALRMESADQWPVESGRLFWCGPIVHHFGHQLGEFGGRILLASLDPRPGQLLFLHPDGDQAFDNLTSWQQAWIRYLNPTNKPVLIRGGGLRARELVVIPQQQRLGCPPTAHHLRSLGRLKRSASSVNEVLVLSRSRYAAGRDQPSLRGSVAGEAALDAWMQRQGARIVYPETLPLEEQLKLLHSTQHLIVAEGSALHALELIGRQPDKTVTVIARRPLWRGMDRALRSRFPQLRWIDAVQALHWLPPANPRVKGVAQLNWTQLTAELRERFGWEATANDISGLENAANAQLAHLQQTLPIQTQRCTAKDRTALRAGGW